MMLRSSHLFAPLVSHLFAPLVLEQPTHRLFEQTPSSNSSSVQDRPDEVRREERQRALLCVRCRHLITFEKFRTTVFGRHLFTFVNPHGILYRIGCFKQAPGCMPEGAPSTFFTWFPGYSWQIQRCGGCTGHIGWRFDGGNEDAFFGLILKHLIETSDGS